MKENFRVTGMTCSACSSRVEKTVDRLEGSSHVMVNLLTGSMQVDFDESVLGVEDIIQAVEKAGYGAFVANESDDSAGQTPGGSQREAASKKAEEELKGMKRRLFWSVGLLIPLMWFSMGHMITGGGHDMDHPLTNVLWQIVFLIPIVFLNRKYFIKGFPSLFHGAPNMDSLIAIGSTAAIVYGAFVLFRMAEGYESGNMALVHQYAGDVYFESAAMILTLITVGKYLEARAKGKTSQAIEKLMDLAPKTVTVVKNGEEVEIPVASLQVGDILLVKPGESIGADGVIISGKTSIDASAMTGESIPVEKKAGDQVISATINKTGAIKVRCMRVGGDTTISQMIKLVEEASASKAPIARLADKIAGVFVPVVMGIALIATLVWLVCGAEFEFALSIGISVLVISCPCALGLATPVAIMVGTGKGAENGILIKSGEALERAHQIDTVVLDKTGTITEGTPKVTDVMALEITEKELLTIACSLEAGSEHPLAEAIVNYAKKQQCKGTAPEDFEAIFGRGVKGTIDGKTYYGGNAALMEEVGVEIDNVKGQMDAFADQGKTPMIFAEAEQVIGLIAVADIEKPSSKEAIAAFGKMGIEVVMLTGDNSRTAEALRQRLEIPKVIAEVLPADKEKHIAALQAEGHKVAMIGDGINDAPALAKADVGIAIGAGTDIAIESADAVLMHSDLFDAVTAIQLSKAVIRNIKENLFWAFFYNIIGIPVAAGVLYPLFSIKLSPMIGAAAMSLSSFCVVSNALRLRKFKGLKQEKTKLLTEIEEQKEKKEMKYELKIEGMMCMHCQRHMTEAFHKMEGVQAEINLEEKTAYITADREISMDEFQAVVEEAGYTLVI
ncbi:MAG: heavy metal translocating P-type ATPase [Firmicutes bacterium]|nr:heavy metal translocating P-type ATPase [Bacillota bacterium]